MTVTYTPDVHDASYKSLVRMMVRWRGSLWKTVVKDLIVWLTAYAAISCTYRLVLDGEHKRLFERVVHYCYKFSDWVPLTFMLGFYVTLVLTRWWSIISNIGFIDNLSLVVSNYIRGTDSRSIMYKRTIVRYMCLMQAMVYRAICKPVKTKFPTLDSLVDAGYLESDEKELFSENNFFLSVHWAMAMARKARDEKLITSDQALQDIFKWCTEFRWSQVVLWVYHWIPVPLVYSQVVFISVRFYFILALVGRQYIEGELSQFPVDIYFPVLTALQFVFYIGWLKVAEALLNPFGEDDDDFDAEWFMARNLRIGLAVVSEENREPPKLRFDKFWRDEHSKEHEMEQIQHKPRIRRTSEPTFASTNLLEISSGDFETNENGEIVPVRRTLLTLIYDSAARIVHVESPHGIHESISTSQLSTDGETAHCKSHCTHHDAVNDGKSSESLRSAGDDVERGCVNSAFDSVDSAPNDGIVEHNKMY